MQPCVQEWQPVVRRAEIRQVGFYAFAYSGAPVACIPGKRAHGTCLLHSSELPRERFYAGRVISGVTSRARAEYTLNSLTSGGPVRYFSSSSSGSFRAPVG